MNWCKVVNCPVSALEERLNSIEGGWAPVVWHFYAEEDGPRALVVFARIRITGQMSTSDAFEIKCPECGRAQTVSEQELALHPACCFCGAYFDEWPDHIDTNDDSEHCE